MIRELIQQIGELFTWVIVVAPWESALRIRLGNRVSVLGAGCWFRIPFIDRIYRQSIRRRMSLIAPMVLTTTDGKTISVGAFLGYSIGDIHLMYDALHHAEATIEAEVSSMIAEVVTRNQLQGCLPPAIEDHVRKTLNLSKYGLRDVEFFVSNFAATKTYRLITGEMRNWMRGSELNTEVADGANKSS